MDINLLLISGSFLALLVLVFCLYQQYKIVIRAEELARPSKAVDKAANELRRRVKAAKEVTRQDRK